MNHSKQDKYLVTFANCFPVKGVKRSTICDLQRGRYSHIPNSLVEIIETAKDKPLKEIYGEIDSDEHDILDEYIQFIIDHDFGFLDDEPEIFQDLNTAWNYPSSITNAIIDFKKKSLITVNHQKAITELSNLNCTCLEIRFFSTVTLEETNRILNMTLKTRINDVRIVLKYSKQLNEVLKELVIKKHKRISQILLYDSPKNSLENFWGVRFTYITQKNLDENKCGQICSQSFTVNVTSFTESINFNNCLNRKISIDDKGNIKNCPSQLEHYGNIKDTSLISVLNTNKFKQLWSIKKDDVKICQSCEYRYICTDCRIFRQDKNDIYSKPAKCNYNPSTCTWE